MNMLNAYTSEVDDPDLAVKEILTQLDLENNTKKHSAAFLTCSYDYIETGVVAAISKALPFPVVGMTTLANAVYEEAGTSLLCLSVLTSDDCQFSAVISDSLEKGECQNVVKKTYTEALQTHDQSPKLGLVFAPIFAKISGESFLVDLTQIAEGVPFFGGVAASSDVVKYENAFVVHEGIHYSDRFALLLISGAIDPKFVVASVSDGNIFAQQAIITKAEGNVVQSVNNIPTAQYLSSLGFVQNDALEGISVVPFLIDHHDGSQNIARAVLMLTDEGFAICGGNVPEGGGLFLGRMDETDVRNTAKIALEQSIQYKNANAVLVFSCLARNTILGLDYLAEIEKTQEILCDTVPWHFAYAGGEICPVYGHGNKCINRFHNYTFPICII